MSFIRDRKSFKTGYQEQAPFNDKIDLPCDFVMVYGFGKDLEERINSFKNRQYEVHFMTGISWGSYQDYLYGAWDGKNHWDDAQCDRDGNYILHHEDAPYMVPTDTYVDYLINRLKGVIDLGIDHLHLEEPEFWQHAGYSVSFKKAYEKRYQKKWQAPHVGLDVMYQSAQLKAELYEHAINKIALTVKKYAQDKYQRDAYVYIPTHSLLNYTQWKIISPEGKLMHMQAVDGYISQVWTGTSREPNVYRGIKKERTFETAFLEYGIMLSLVAMSNRRIWFLNDPIEDNPAYTWDNYKMHYVKTLIASLLHPSVNDYEVCPWPNRVFNRKLPIGSKEVEPKLIPESYDVFLNNMFNTLSDMPKDVTRYQGFSLKVGLALSDNAMYQRNYPDQYQNQVNNYAASLMFPDYYGLALPLLKNGIPLQGFSLDRILDKNYLNDYDMLILSYDYLKPEKKEINEALKAYIESGRIILFVGSNEEPYHQLSNWWKKEKFNSATDHLLHLLGIEEEGIHHINKGYFGYLPIRSLSITTNIHDEEAYVKLCLELIHKKEKSFEPTHHMMLSRKNYLVVACLDESISQKPVSIMGKYIDLLDASFSYHEIYHVDPGNVALLYDVEKADDLSIVGTTYRIESISKEHDNVRVVLSGRKHLKGKICFKSLKKPKRILKGHQAISYTYQQKNNILLMDITLDNEANTLLIQY